MATYAYQQNYYDGAAAGYVQYNITPELGTPVAPGEKVTISGVLKSRDFAISTIVIRLWPMGSTQAWSTSSAVSAKKNTVTAFSIIFEAPAEQSYFPEGRLLPLDIQFMLLHSASSGDALIPTADQQLSWLRYRIKPEIKQADFFRYGIDEDTELYERKNDGVYCMCAGLKISLASGYTAADITVARITAAVQQRSITQVKLSSDVLNSALGTAGYVEQLGPGIFADMTFNTDSAHALLIEIGDEFDVAAGSIVIPRAFANMCLVNFETGGVCFGGFPKSTLNNPLFECYYPMIAYADAKFYGGIGNIQAGTIAALGSTSSGSYQDGTAVFPTPFAEGSTPVVVIGFGSSSTSGTFGRCCVSVLSATNTGFTFRFFNGDSSNRNPDYSYIAFGTPA